jgi:hypothetical protein
VEAANPVAEMTTMVGYSPAWRKCGPAGHRQDMHIIVIYRPLARKKGRC